MEETLETQFGQWLQARLAQWPASDCLRLGIGDDAAVLRMAEGRDTVVTTDLLTDGIDFLLREVDPRHVGHKALGANLSDLAAMAAEPVAVVVSLVLPQAGCGNRSALELAIELYEGMLPLADELGVALAGGDTNTWDGPLAISITALGATTKQGPLRRDGGRPGDRLLVTGQLGGSLLGRHLQVEPRCREALLLHEKYTLHAGIDISDGLAIDASRLAESSNCGAVFDLATIPISPDAHVQSSRDGCPPLEHALGDGEDFELLLAVPPEVAEQIVQDNPLPIPITPIGRLIPDPGLWQQTGQSPPQPLEPTGWLH